MHDGALIADSGPLLGLALVDCVRHLQQMYAAVLVPQAVVDEIAGQGVFRRASDLSYVKIGFTPRIFFTSRTDACISRAG